MRNCNLPGLKSWLGRCCLVSMISLAICGFTASAGETASNAPDKNPTAASSVITVKGNVVDETGEPVIGAHVSVQGTNKVTVTDIEGNYTLANVPANSSIVFNAVGYVSRTIKASDTAALANVYLDSTGRELDEVVVVGYGVQKKVNLSGAVETLNSEQLKDRGTNNAVLVLQGLVPNPPRKCPRRTA